MSLYLYSYPSLHINPGGPSYKTAMLYDHLKKRGIDVKRFDMWDSQFKPGFSDLFYIFTANISTYSMCMNLKAKGIPYIVNPIFFSNHSGKTIKAYRKAEKFFGKVFVRTRSDYDLTAEICQNSQKILPNTIAEGDLLQTAFDLPKDKFEVIHNGVEKRFADASPELFFQKFGQKDFVLYTGHLGPVRKNGMNIIKAMQKSKADCVIIADVLKNEEGQKCLDMIEKSSNIKYLGWLDHKDPMLASAYAACHTYILPTRYETPGRAALEAGLAGANIVITPLGGTKEYFADLAEYPDPLNINSIVNSIERALSKKKNDKLKARILDNYIWSVITEKTISVIEDICN